MLAGDATLSVRGDEAEEAWRMVKPILATREAGSSPLLEYPAGSDGPNEVGPGSSGKVSVG